MTLDEIIERLEKATGPDAKLDVEIWAALYAPSAFILRSPFNGEWCAFEDDNPKGHLVETRGKPKMRTPYTSSIDAALTLVPEGYAVERITYWPKQPSSADIIETRLGHDGQYYHGGSAIEGAWGSWRADGATPALALCIAALKAQEAAR